MTYDIRVKTKNLFFEGIVPFVILLGVLIGFFPMGGPNYILIAMICLFGIFDCLHNALLPLLRSRFVITDETLRVILAREQMDYHWEEIKEVSLEESPKEINLKIVTEKGARTIALSSFDHKLVWSLINERVNEKKPGTTIRPGQKPVPAPVSSAFPGEKQSRTTPAPSPTVAKDLITFADSQSVKKTGWIICCICLLILIVSALFLEWLVLILITPLLFLGIVAILNRGVTVMDSYSITRKNRLGTYSILWAEIEIVEVSPFGDGVSFRGSAKRLVIPGPGWLEETDRTAFNLKILKQVNQHQTRLLENRWTIFYITRNCRV